MPDVLRVADLYALTPVLQAVQCWILDQVSRREMERTSDLAPGFPTLAHQDLESLEDTSSEDEEDVDEAVGAAPPPPRRGFFALLTTLRRLGLHEASRRLTQAMIRDFGERMEEEGWAQDRAGRERVVDGLTAYMRCMSRRGCEEEADLALQVLREMACQCPKERPLFGALAKRRRALALPGAPRR